MKSRPETILKGIKEREEQTPMSDKLKKFLNSDELHGVEEHRHPSIDEVIGLNFDYDDIMHYLKIETQEHTPLEQDARRTRRVAILCRMFLELDY